MGKIKKILENELVEGAQPTDIYPVTSTKAVYNENNERLDKILEVSQAKLSELEGKLHSIQEINGYDVATITNNAIKIDGSLQSAGLYRLLSIPNDNYTSIYGKASSYGQNSYYIVAFWNSITPSTASLISGIVCQTSYVNQNFNIQIPSGTKLIGVTYYSTTGAAEVTLVKETHKLEEIEHEIAEIEENLPSQIQSEVSTAVAPFTKTKNAVDAMLESTEAQVYSPNDFTEDGYYNSNNTLRTSGYDYTSLPIIHVVEGQKIYWHKWSTNTEIGNALAVCCYDNDGLPYNGSNARINYENLTTKDFENGEFSFVIPSNCSQIGVSFNFPTYPVQSGASFVVGDNTIELTPLAKDLINQAVEIDRDGGDRTAHFFLKGNSNVVYSSSKKLGIIAAGQSNIDGRNAYNQLPVGFINPNSKVKICKNSNGTFTNFEVVDGGAGNDWSFDAILYDALTNPSYGNQSEIYVVKKSMGGTSIDPNGATDYHWTAEYEGLPAGHSLLRTFESFMRDAITTQGNNFDIKAFIWHQGEGDADNADVASRYYENLKNMIAYVRGIVGNPRLHFFCGNLSNHNVVNPYRSVINEAYAKIASEDPYFHCIDMRDAVLEDSWHFNYQWSIYFGQKVYDEMIDTGIISGTKINPQKPI